MIRILLAVVLLTVTGAATRAQTTSATTPPAPQPQPGSGPTGTMYNGNNLVRFPLGRPPSPDAASPATTSSGVTGAQGPRDASGSGAGGGEH